MNEEEFKGIIEEFTEKPAAELSMDDDLGAVGVDSIGMFEFLLKLEGVLGEHRIEVTPEVETLADLYDAVLDGITGNAA
ncbi:MAG: acyl carrier protein [Micropruina sp.]|uniref:acyl carrier protein n=1 Tax=Micropruina sp. TaxID=2737536 RepID=UPI0039E6B197